MNQCSPLSDILFDPKLEGNIVFTASYIAIVAAGDILNILLIISVLRDKTMRSSPTYVVLVNLAFSDVMFLTFAPSAHFLTHYVGGMTNTICSISTFVYLLSMDVSAYSMMTFSVLRYLLVGHPLFARRHVSTKRLVYICLAMWVFFLATNSFMFQAVVYGQIETSTCFVQLCVFKEDFNIIVGLIPVFGFILPLLLITGFHIAKLVRFQNNVIKSDTRCAPKKVSKRAVLAIVVVFVICYIPYTFVLFTTYVIPVKFSTNTFKTLILLSNLALVNSIFNPVLYFFLSRQRRLGCC